MPRPVLSDFEEGVLEFLSTQPTWGAFSIAELTHGAAEMQQRPVGPNDRAAIKRAVTKLMQYGYIATVPAWRITVEGIAANG